MVYRGFQYELIQIPFVLYLGANAEIFLLKKKYRQIRIFVAHPKQAFKWKSRKKKSRSSWRSYGGDQ
jgi:hypothetical protein